MVLQENGWCAAQLKIKGQAFDLLCLAQVALQCSGYRYLE